MAAQQAAQAQAQAAQAQADLARAQAEAIRQQSRGQVVGQADDSGWGDWYKPPVQTAQPQTGGSAKTPEASASDDKSQLRQKWNALDDALANGVITRAEYDNKLSVLLNQRDEGTSSPISPARFVAARERCHAKYGGAPHCDNLTAQDVLRSEKWAAEGAQP